jgi:hypothetical protein
VLGLRVPPLIAAAACASAFLCAGEAAADEPILVEFHYKPVPEVQMAIWIEDKDGKHVQDILVTQATGKYGIGNRPGRWDFVSSWREPYGPRPSVLPVWAHRRGKTYPKLIFHDDDPADLESLGWHENTSSAENYYCRPLTPSEHETISVDTKTCPSPQTFQSDKGKFDPKGTTAVYPPRNDLIMFEPGSDHADSMQLAALNDLDAITAATPPGDKNELTIFLLPADVVARAPLTAYVEVSLEDDQNPSHTYDREDDHYVDPRLEAYGVGYLGQPSVVYKVAFDPRNQGFVGTVDYAGHGDWNGATGTLHPPDNTISSEGGSGADRLKVVQLNGETFRWGVYSYGGEGGGTTTSTTGDTDGPSSDSDGESGTGDDTTTTGGGGEEGGWGQCKPRPPLAPVTDLRAEGVAFDKVKLTFTIPPQDDPEFELSGLRVFHITGDMELTPERLAAAHEVPIDVTELAAPGQPSTVTVAQLWGDYTYQFGVTYEDKCTNESGLVTASFTTEPQKFQTVDSFCFVATAAYGAPWAAQVAALRSFRDAYLKTSPTGLDLVRFYYAYSPPLARVIHKEPLLRALARVVLQPVADAASLTTKRD